MSTARCGICANASRSTTPCRRDPQRLFPPSPEPHRPRSPSRGPRSLCQGPWTCCRGPWSPGVRGPQPAGPGDFRTHLPRFKGENRERNERLIAALTDLAAEKGLRPSQLAIAWVLAKGDSIIPVIGARTRAQLEDSLAALDVTLSPEEIARIEEAVPASAVAGTRYDEHQMRMLDSER